MRIGGGTESLDRRDLGPIHLRGEHGARLDGRTVHMDGAATALGRIATYIRACQAALFTQEFHEKRAVLDFMALFDTVDGDGQFDHVTLLTGSQPADQQCDDAQGGDEDPAWHRDVDTVGLPHRHRSRRGNCRRRRCIGDGGGSSI